MSFSIMTNLASLQSHSSLRKTQNALELSLERLSTGKRINSAKDGAASMAIGNRMTSQIRGLNQAIKNTSAGKDLVNTADGAMSTSDEILQKMRELSVSVTETMSGDDLTSLGDEFTQLQAELDRISGTTEFNNIKILDGTFTSKNIQVGADAGQTISVSIADMDSTALGVDSGTLDLTSFANAQASITAIDTAIGTVDSERSKMGALSNRFDHTITNLENIVTNTESARSTIMDADMATESANLTKQQTQLQIGVSIASMANSNTQILMGLLG